MWLVASAVGGGSLLSTAMKHLFARGRPGVVPHLVAVTSRASRAVISMLVGVLYLTLGALLARFAARRRTKAYILTVAILVTFLVGSSRIYLGVHYRPTFSPAGAPPRMGARLLARGPLPPVSRRGREIGLKRNSERMKPPVVPAASHAGSLHQARRRIQVPRERYTRVPASTVREGSGRFCFWGQRARFLSVFWSSADTRRAGPASSGSTARAPAIFSRAAILTMDVADGFEVGKQFEEGEQLSQHG